MLAEDYCQFEGNFGNANRRFEILKSKVISYQKVADELCWLSFGCEHIETLDSRASTKSSLKNVTDDYSMPFSLLHLARVIEAARK